MTKLKLAEQLKFYRHRNGLTQDDLSKKLGVKRSTISSWETGISVPDIYTLLDIVKILDVSLIELIGIETKAELILPPLSNTSINRKKEIIHKIDLLDEEELNNLEFSLRVILAHRKCK